MISSNVIILSSQSCEGDRMRRTAQPKADSAVSVGFWCKMSAFRHLQELLLCIGAHGEEMLLVPLSSPLHRSRDSNGPQMKPASRIWLGWVCATDVCTFGNTLFFPL